MNNKGFTLIELLAVMVILVSISLVAVGGISASLERRDIKDCKEQQEVAVGAAKIYFSMETGSNVITGVTVEGLIAGGYLDSKYVNGSNGKLSNSDMINLPSGASEYKVNGGEVGESCN